MREIVFDTETTGLDPSDGHRIVEIGCVELFNHMPTGRTWQRYVNPERSVPIEASNVHGLKNEFLETQPLFAEIVSSFLEFIEDAPLVAHNAPFDVSFVNAELKRHGFATLAKDRATDTVALARRLFPGAPASLDALCKRFGVDLSARQLHGALLDALLLAEVYLELRGGRQPVLAMDKLAHGERDPETTLPLAREYLVPRPHAPSEEELSAHEGFLTLIKDPLWNSA